jgi:hypothetical protein
VFLKWIEFPVDSAGSLKLKVREGEQCVAMYEFLFLKSRIFVKFVVVLKRWSEFRNKNNGILWVSLINCVYVCGFFYLFINRRGWILNLRVFFFCFFCWGQVFLILWESIDNGDRFLFRCICIQNVLVKEMAQLQGLCGLVIGLGEDQKCLAGHTCIIPQALSGLGKEKRRRGLQLLGLPRCWVTGQCGLQMLM